MPTVAAPGGMCRNAVTGIGTLGLACLDRRAPQGAAGAGHHSAALIFFKAAGSTA